MADKPVKEEKYNKDLDVEQKLSEGGILAKLFIEVQGNDKETAKKALDVTINDNLLNEPSGYLLEVKMFDMEKYQEKKRNFFSGVAEAKLVADDFPDFVDIVMRYGPTAIEIIEPQEVRLDYEQMHSLVSRVSALAHVYSTKILTMLKDPERQVLYEQMLGEKHKND